MASRCARRAIAASSVLVLGGAVVGCGTTGAIKTVTTTQTVTVTAPAASSTASSGPASAQSQNAQVINQAANSPDNQAQLGAAKIEAILRRKLGLDSQLNFTISGNGGCYVKLGADAVNFENQSENILRSPNGKDVVFVQSDTATPLVRCLKAVNTALGW